MGISTNDRSSGARRISALAKIRLPAVEDKLPTIYPSLDALIGDSFDGGWVGTASSIGAAALWPNFPISTRTSRTSWFDPKTVLVTRAGRAAGRADRGAARHCVG